MMKRDPPEPWYADGLRFECTRCGNCCTGPPGYVWFDDDECRSMAEAVGVSEAVFRGRYAKKTFGRWTLRDHRTSRGHDCVFLRFDGEGKSMCSIYSVRPAQCRTWPFWPENLASEADYLDAARRCPGMQRGVRGEGKPYDLHQIRVIRDAVEE